MDEQQEDQPPKQSVLSEPVVIAPQDSGALKVSHDNDSPPAEQPTQTTGQVSENVPAAPQPTATQEQPPANQPSQVQDPQNQWQYQSGQLSQQGAINDAIDPDQTAAPQSGLAEDSIKWNASEFVSHEKTRGWYVILAFGAVALGAAIYFITKDIFSVVVIGLIALTVGFLAAMKPRVLDYSISPDGIQVGSKHFTYETFRSFSFIEDGQMPSIQLLPQKRFMVPIIMYFAPADGDRIVKVLGDYLPFEHRERDLVDKISSKIHF